MAWLYSLDLNSAYCLRLQLQAAAAKTPTKPRGGSGAHAPRGLCFV